jgi:DNA polymerase III subunit alpha
MNQDHITFVGLHRHGMYSLLDGLGSPEQIVTRLKAINQCACATTEHGSAFSHIHFGTVMRAAGLRPLYGVEFYHCNNMHERGEMRSDKKEQGRQTGRLAHLTVLAQSQVGYKNLLKMYKLSYQEGFYYRPRIDWDCVVEHQEGLIVMTGCVGGLISRMIQHSQSEEAHRYCDYLSRRIEQFYVELVPCPGLEKTYHPDGSIKSPSSYEHCNQLYRIAKDLSLPMVMTDDGHFPDPSKHEAQDAAYCIGQRKKMHEERYRIAKYHHYCSGEEIMARAREVMPEVPEVDLLSACAETVRIAERCDVELPRSTGPVYNIALAVEHQPGMTAFDLLVRWVEDGKAYRRSLGLLPPEDSIEWRHYEERLAYELDIIAFHAFSNYFLTVCDIVRWCRAQKYWCIARGSCGGSLACWYLGITQIDPMFFKLPVERFIDKTRKDMPDIDLDIDARYRDRVFTYLEEKYGKEHTAQIAALSTFRPKQAVRDVCDIYGLPQSVGHALINLLPEIENEGGIKAKGLLHQLFRESHAAQALLAAHPELAVAADLEGQIRNQTIHAAGFIVDCNDLSEIVGVVEQPGKARVVACDMNFAAQQGLLKIDALSVEMMAAVSELLDQEGHDHDWLYRLPFDDSEVYRILTEGRNTGLFQFKGQTTGRILKDLKPSNIFDLVALAALGRPGPLQSGGTREYIERKHGRMEMPDYHPKVMEVLGETYGVIVYQEQVMQLMRVAGLDWPDVHKIRKLISKSGGTQALEQYHQPYLEGMKRAGIGKEEANHLWVQCQKAGNYVFVKAHGAQYAVHAYWTAYLKAHYAAAFACVMVNHEKKEPQQRELLREFKADGGTLQLLDPNTSQVKFSSPKPNLILGGFQCLKGVGEIAAKELVAGAPYKNWTDFLLKCPAALARDLQAIGLHDGRIDLDVALAIAPWFVEIVYSPYEEEVFERMRCVTVRSVQEALHGGYAGRVVRMLGRLTDIETAISKTGNGLAERATLTVTDPTGSLPIWFAAWCWEEIKRGREPLHGPDEGIGNSVLITAKISNDGHRLFGEDCLVMRASRGRPVVKPKEKPSLQGAMALAEATDTNHQPSERDRERHQLLEEAQAHNAEIKRRRAGGMKRLESQVMQFIQGLD